MDLREINGMQEKNVRQLKRMDVETVEDLLKVYPEKYQPYPDPVMPCHAYSGVCAVAAYVDPYKFRSYGKCVKAWIMDNKGGICHISHLDICQCYGSMKDIRLTVFGRLVNKELEKK